MKKKLLALALAACMLCSFSTTAFAEDTVYGDGDAEIPATYHQDSSYFVTIPETINLNDGIISMEFATNIEDNEYIAVSLPKASVNFMKNGFSNSGYFVVNDMRLQDEAVIMEVISGETNKDFYYRIETEGLRAGDYETTVRFSFNLRQR